MRNLEKSKSGIPLIQIWNGIIWNGIPEIPGYKKNLVKKNQIASFWVLTYYLILLKGRAYNS